MLIAANVARPAGGRCPNSQRNCNIESLGACWNSRLLRIFMAVSLM
jgi:hypothetical protein